MELEEKPYRWELKFRSALVNIWGCVWSANVPNKFQFLLCFLYIILCTLRAIYLPRRFADALCDRSQLWRSWDSYTRWHILYSCCNRLWRSRHWWVVVNDHGVLWHARMGSCSSLAWYGFRSLFMIVWQPWCHGNNTMHLFIYLISN